MFPKQVGSLALPVRKPGRAKLILDSPGQRRHTLETSPSGRGVTPTVPGASKLVAFCYRRLFSSYRHGVPRALPQRPSAWVYLAESGHAQVEGPANGRDSQVSPSSFRPRQAHGTARALMPPLSPLPGPVVLGIGGGNGAGALTTGGGSPAHSNRQTGHWRLSRGCQ